MNLRRAGRTAALVVVALALMAGAATPVQAHGTEWYQTDCTTVNGNGHPRLDVWWQPHPDWAGGAHYWTDEFGHYTVNGWIMWKYAQLDHQCGVLGPPTGNSYLYHAGGGIYYTVQWFQCGFIYYQTYPDFGLPDFWYEGGCFI